MFFFNIHNYHKYTVYQLNRVFIFKRKQLFNFYFDYLNFKTFNRFTLI